MTDFPTFISTNNATGFKIRRKENESIFGVAEYTN
jgi:hypothetical protein